ncbi:hypothetical protein UCRPA7_1397 [Phaeoacremonium minimum UCRPA7]|uniref:Uncharacterized protein n=1 Tax=Phaeoacremonium minimum (strain UCR-PA7) TaxID=1286976 RepID=R8BUQ8_PHAM7|nr:hypothetical protein UCRPA7_1397 [Phaeoacremonium minimum UCRPA7]EOO03092.1 hypothetical protein UCRPA7_1397 [Phaeoacremonium minimum UCRPA7]
MAPPIFLPVTGLAPAKQIVGNVLTVKKELKEARDAAQNTSSGFDDIASKIGYPEDIEEDTKQFKKLRRDMEDLLNERDNLRDRLDQSIEAYGEVADLNSDELVKRAIKLPDKVTAMLLRVNQAVFSNMDNILELHEDYRHLLSADDQHIESQRNVDPGAESQLADTNNVQRLKAALELSSIETEELKEQLHDMEKEMDNVTRDLRTKYNTAQSESAALRKQVKTFQAIKDDRSKLHQRLAKADAEVLEMKEDLKVANALSESCVQERQSMKDSLDAANVTIVNKTAMITELEASIASLEMTGEKDEKTSNEIIQKLHGRLDVLAAESNKNYWDMRNQLTDENLGLLSEESRLENEIKNLKDTNRIQDLQARLERNKALGLEEEVGQLTTTIEHMRKKLDDSRRGLREAQESVRHLQSDVHDIEYDRDCYAQKLVAANRSKERLEEKLQAALARLTEQSTDMMDVTAFNTMHNQLQGLRDKVEELTIARDSGADSNGMLKRTNEQMEKAIAHLTASERLRSIENGVLAQELEETRQKLLDAENRLAAPTHEVSQLRFELERKKIELGATKQISDQRKAERDDFQKSWMEALEASNQRQAEASKASIDVQRLQQELTQAKDRLQDYDSRMAVVSAKNHSLQTNLSKLQDEKKTVESHVTKLEGSCARG